MARPDITELGESLLSGKIERVRKQEKRAEKDQRKALLMGLGLQLGAGAVQSIFDRKQQNIADTILNSETRRLYNMTDLQNKEYMTYKQKLADQGLSVFDFEFNRHYEKRKALNEWEGINDKLFKAQDKLDREEATKAAEEQVKITNRLDKLYAGISTKEELVEQYKDRFNRPTNLLSYLGGKIGDAVTGQSQEEREAMVLEQIRKENLVPLEEYNTVVQLWKDSRNRKTKAALIENYVDDPYAPREYTTGIKEKADGTIILTKVKEVYDEAKGAWRATPIETETLGAEAVAKQVLAANRADGQFLTQALNSTNEKGRAALTAMNKEASKIDNHIERSAFIVSGATDILLNEEYRKTSLDPLQKESLEMLQNRIRNDEFAFKDDDGNIDFDGMKDYYDSTHAMLKSVTQGFKKPAATADQPQERTITDNQGNTMTATEERAAESEVMRNVDPKEKSFFRKYVIPEIPPENLMRINEVVNPFEWIDQAIDSRQEEMIRDLTARDPRDLSANELKALKKYGPKFPEIYTPYKRNIQSLLGSEN